MSAVPAQMRPPSMPRAPRLPRTPGAKRGFAPAQAWALLRDGVRDFARPLGYAGALGALCLIGALALWWTSVRGQDAAAQSLRREVRTLREQARQLPPPQRQPDATQQLAAFHAFFPERARLSTALDEIARLAAQRQLALLSGDYKYTEEKNLRLGRYELRLPVRGSYPQVYGLIAAALNAMPSLALDEIIIKRESRVAGEVEAQLRFSLYVRQD